MSELRVTQNKFGRWEIRETVREPGGKVWTRRESLGKCVQTKQDAEAELAKRKAALVPSLPAPQLWTLGRVIDAYVVAKPGQDFNLRYPKRYMGHLEPSKVTPLESDAYARLRTKVEPVSKSTIRRELGAVRAAMNWAGKKYGIPVGAVDLSGLPDGPARPFFLEEEEEAQFYRSALAMSSPTLRLKRISRFVALALDTAARTEAIETLTWDRVDLKAGIIDYRDPTKPPSRKRRSVVPISSRLRPVLERAWRERTQDKWVLDHPGAIRKAYETFVAGLPGKLGQTQCHDLRRTWATLAARAGVPMWEIAGVLGDTIATVTKHYAHHSPSHLRDAVNRRFSDAGKESAPP